MDVGIVGLGRMGANMTRRLRRRGHDVVVTDLQKDAVERLAQEGARPAASVREMAATLPAPRVVWLMVPAGGATQSVFDQALEALEKDDVIIDGANSNWQDSRRRGGEALEHGIWFVDAGVSGGVWGLEEGYNLMVGGEVKAIDAARLIFEALAPDDGFAHVGPVGAGHFVKMVHNGIEYGMLQAYGEGFAALQGYPHADLDLEQIAHLWTHGAVVRSWVLELLASSLAADPDLAAIEGYIDDSGMGRWTVDFGVDQAIALPVITAALYARFVSRRPDAFSAKVVAALRNAFGGHAVKEA